MDTHTSPGGPVVGRTLWYDRKNTYLVLDWGTGQEDREFTVSFNFPGRDAGSVADGQICSRRAAGNVLVVTLPVPGQKIASQERFWSPKYGQKEPAVRYTVSQKGKPAVFGHVIRTFDGHEPPPFAAAWEVPPVPEKAVRIRLRQDGQERIVALSPVWQVADRMKHCNENCSSLCSRDGRWPSDAISERNLCDERS